jgi:hypothetical protein
MIRKLLVFLTYEVYIRMNLRCAECQCAPQECTKQIFFRCKNCTKGDCCCIGFHQRTTDGNGHPSSLFRYLGHVKRLFAAALGIEILCIAAAEIGENTGLYLFGFNPAGVAIAYVMGYTLAGFTTLVTILGRYRNGSLTIDISSCCSALEEKSGQGLIQNVNATFKNFTTGLTRLLSIHRQPNMRNIIRTSLVVLISAESACILTAETVDLIFYKYSILLSVPLALLAGAFAVVVPEAYRKVKSFDQPKSKLDNSIKPSR